MIQGEESGDAQKSFFFPQKRIFPQIRISLLIIGLVDLEKKSNLADTGVFSKEGCDLRNDSQAGRIGNLRLCIILNQTINQRLKAKFCSTKDFLFSSIISFAVNTSSHAIALPVIGSNCARGNSSIKNRSKAGQLQDPQEKTRWVFRR
jgi:hypothetical protein